ncbi:uncharacterized protein LOC124288767 [Haliotis rubra]|uniref:uncharacterized protein LOC124288767 n=1 Tax=Haliotis rubra TaxID=36100 RepID=UPI001EE55EAB|nr:uncharacterized protein LOC124288767 [Haliotis rubra]
MTSPVMAAPMKVGTNTLESSSKSVIEQIADKFKVAENSGPLVDKGVSDLIDGLVATRLDEKQRAELFDKHLCPANVQKLKPPRVNTGIWQSMDLEARQRDAKSQKLQEIFLRGLVPLISAVDKLNDMSNRKSSDHELVNKVSSVMGDIVDGVALIASGNYELSIKRRDAIRQNLRAEYKPLCSHSNPVTEFLFGDDLSDKIKDLSETNKLVSRLASPGRQMSVRGRGSARGRGWRGRGRATFLEYNTSNFHSPNRYNPYPPKFQNQQGNRGSPLRGRRPHRM